MMNIITTSESNILSEERPYSELFWPVFSRIWTEYGVSLRNQSECREMRTRVTPNTDNFHAVLVLNADCF